MRLLCIALLSTFLFSCQPGQEKTEKKETPRKTEYVTEYYPDGKKKIEGELVNEKRHGIWKYYYENGFIWSEGMYKHGERNGFSSIYFEDGSLKMNGNYKNDLKVGTWKIWNPDGSLFKAVNLDEMLTQEDSLKLGL